MPFWATDTVVTKMVDAAPVSARAAMKGADKGVHTHRVALFVGKRTLTNSVDTDSNPETSVVAGPTMALVGVFVDASVVAKELSARANTGSVLASGA